MKRIYVSGASSEWDRCTGWIAKVSATDGLEITHDWSKSFDGPKIAEEDLSPRLRREFVEADIDGVRRADYVWLLAPSSMTQAPAVKMLHKTKGAWFELGLADMCYRLTGSPRIIVSGPERYQSIFTEVASHFFETDEAAFEWLRSQR